jgi:geranylgeranyl diphosphate synthase type I
LKGNAIVNYNKTFAFDERKYRAYLRKVKEGMSSEISSILSETESLRLNEKITYALQTQGKLLRPTLVMLSGQSVGGNWDQLKKLALTIELLHNATLVHDDILDNDTYRRDALAICSKYGVRTAILVGDALASLSLNLSAEYNKEISKIVSQTCLSLCDGEYMDAAEITSEPSEQRYFEKIRKKTASLFKAATQCGAIAGGGTPSEIAALAEFGENYGIAYQISDDLSDIASLKEGLIPGQNDFLTLPFIHLYKSTGKGEKYFQDLSPEELYGHLTKFNCLRYCLDKIKKYLNNAVANLEPLRGNVCKSYLLKMVDNLLQES